MGSAYNERDPRVLATIISLLILTTVAIVLRVIGRRSAKKELWYDDVLIGAAQVGSAYTLSCSQDVFLKISQIGFIAFCVDGMLCWYDRIAVSTHLIIT